MRKLKTYKYNGEKLTIRQLSTLAGCRYDTMLSRINLDWSIEKAVNTEVKKVKAYEKTGDISAFSISNEERKRNSIIRKNKRGAVQQAVIMYGYSTV